MLSLLPRRSRLPALLLATGLLAGCAGGAAPDPVATQASAAPSTQGAVAEPVACAPDGVATLTWPDVVPADLPVPPAGTLTDVQPRGEGLTVVRFSTTTSIRESVLFLIEQMPAAGYTLSRGDAENTEADVPFVKGDLRGVMRMIAVEECRTEWLMALATGGAAAGAPVLPPRPDASPLPFG